MGQDSKISWCHHTLNPWRGCSKVSAGCARCYADALSKRNPGTLGIWGPNGTRVVAADAHWKQLVRWDRWAAEGTCWSCGGKPTRVDDGDDECQTCGGSGSVDGPYVARVFCASLADVAEGPDTMPAESWPAVQAARERLVATAGPLRNTVLLLLTKRPENLATYFPADFLARHWIGTSVENQAAADERIPHLLGTPAAVRFISAEPLLSAVKIPMDCFGYWQCPQCGHPRDWDNHPPFTFRDRRGVDDDVICHGRVDDDGQDGPCDYCGPMPFHRSIDWVIVGGESGPNARPMHPAWARSIRDQCGAAGVAFHFKQWGEWCPKSIAGAYGDKVLTGHVGLNGQFGGAIWGTTPPPEFMVRVGKHADSRELDGQTWDQFPTTTEARP